MTRPDWDRQFAETEWEKRERWRATREKRRAEGKCWQCAKLISECTCPNVKHAAGRSALARATEEKTGIMGQTHQIRCLHPAYDDVHRHAW